MAFRPRDPQLRFLRGVVQIEQKRNNDAIVTFQRMTEDFPELPEPYNNLAVLYAGQGQYDKARAALELAIRTHPSYATAHENLGDVYTKMASESYTKALQLDSGNNAAQIKLNVIKDLSSSKQVKPSAVTASAAAPIPVSATPTPTASATPPVAQATTVRIEPTPDSKSIPSGAVASTKPVVSKYDETDVVYEAVVKWANAWSDKDVGSYLASYGKAFNTPNGESRKEWEKERRARIEGKNSISIALESPTVQVKGSSATVKFRQSYQADSLTSNTRKTLKLSKADGSWKIVEETTGK